MYKHASMNRAYRIVWSAARNAYVVAAEIARGRSKSSRSASAPATSAIIVAFAALAPPGLALAQVVPATTVVPVSGNTNAYISPNGVPVVNINTANSAGVSHNQYSRYDVEANGLVLNNGNMAQSARQSQLAGQVVANINLAAEARVILNEVVSPRRSALAGFTEVLGGRADVIVANPYGITCAGCGFINTDRITLTTGTPNFGYDGSVAGFNVNRGDVLINGGGLNASAQQILDIVTRSVKIDGQINTAPGGSLGIVTGLNQWSYATREVTGSTSAADATPSYAIDSSALGGMYAGRIRLIATEAGVGVRMLGEAAASADDFTLTSAGKVLVQSKLSAERDLALASTAGGGDAITLNDANLSARRKLDLTAVNGGATLSGGVLVAGTDLTGVLGSLSDSASTASVTDNNKRYAGGTLALDVNQGASLNGVSYGAGGALAATTGSLAIGADGATLYGGTTLALGARAGDLSLATAAVRAAGDLSLTAATGSISTAAGDAQGIQSTAGNIALSAAAGFTNAGTLSADAGSVNVRIDGTLDNTGNIHAASTLDIADMRGDASENLDNSGTMIADGALAVRAATVLNTGSMQGTAGTTLSADSLDNRGVFVASNTVGQSGTFTLGSLSNQGTMQSADDLDLAVTSTLANSGKLLATDDLAVTAGAAGTTLAISNSGVLQAGDRLSLAGTAGGTNATLNNQAGTISGNELGIVLASITNTGVIQGGSSTASIVSVAGTLNNNAGAKLILATASAGGGTVDANTLTNAGILQSQGNLAMTIGSTLDNQSGGQLLSGGTMSMRGRTGTAYVITDNGRIQSGGLLDIKGYGNGNAVNVTVGGSGVLLGNTMDVNAVSLNVSNGGVVSSAGNMSLALGNLAFGGSSARIVAATTGSGSATVNLANGYSNVGAVHSNGNLSLLAPWITNTATGGISALGTLTVNATGGDLYNAGALYAGSQLNASASNNLTNAAGTGTIDSSGSMNLGAGNTFTNNGDIVASQDIAISAPVFRNEITGGVPTRLWTPIAWSPTEMYDHYESGYYNEYFHYRANGTRSQYFVTPIPTVKPTIVAGRNMSITGFSSGYNGGGVLAASNGTLTLSGTGTFTNDDLNLITEQWKKQWYDWADCGLFWLDCDYYNGVDYAEWRTDSSTAYSFGAGIFAGTLNASGFSLVNHSSPWAASPTARSSSGAGSSALSSGVSAVSGASALSFGGLTITLPTNPNGYFVVSKNPDASYLVETNPLFNVGSNFVGSDYLAVRYGFNPDTVQKRLGDANYEAYLIRQQLISQTGNNILKGYGDEAAQMQRLMDQAVTQGKSLGLTFGQAPTASQLASLKEDIVWMVETVVGGQKVLAPVVYLASSTREMVEGGAVIAGNDVNLDVKSLTNTGGTIKGDNKLAIRSQGDITNTSGTIKGGDVSLTSTEGSIKNETLVSGTGNDKHYATNIGKTAGIVATGNLDLDAAKDITVKGADVKAGGDVSLAAGENVTFDTIENKSADTTYKKVGGLLAGGFESNNVITTTNIGSTLGAGGNLTIKSGKDTTIAGSSVDVGGNMKVDAKGDFNVLARQDKVETNTTSTVSGIGVGGGVFGSTETTTNAFKGTNVGSTIKVGGDASVTANTMTLEGSKMDVGGSADIDAKEVKLLAGKDEDRSTTVTKTTTFLKMDSDSGAGAEASASAQAKGKSASAQASASANAEASQEFKLAEMTTTTTTHEKSTAVVSSLTVGGNLNVKNADKMVLEGANLEVGGDADLNVKDLQVLTAKNTERTTTSTTENSIGLYVDSNASAEASASARATGNGGAAKAGAEAKAEASSTATVGWRGKQSDSLDESLTNTGANIKIGGNLKTQGDKATFVGANVDVGGDADMQAKEIKVLAAEDTYRSTSSSSQHTAGLYIDGGASAEASAKGNAQTNMGLAPTGGAEASASAQAEASAGLRYEYKGEKSEEGGSNAVVSTFKVGGNMTRKADTITDQGTSYEVGGDFSQEAKTVNMLAAKNTSYSSESSDRHDARVGVYAEAHAEAGASANAGAMGAGAAKGANTDAGAGAGIKAKYEYEGSAASASSSEAVTVSIKTGGNFSSKSANKTTIEGANIEAGGDVNLEAGSLDFKAARNTSSESESSRTAGAELKVDLLGKEAGLEAEYGQEGSKSTSSEAVVGSIKGGNIKVKTTEGDARFEGTNLDADNKIAIDAKGGVKFDAAYSESTSSSNSLSADLSLSASKGEGGKKGDRGIGGGVGYEQSNESSKTAQTSSLNAKGGIDISAGKDASFEGTQIKSDGDVAVKAGGDVSFKAAVESESSSSVRAEVRAGFESGAEETKKSGSVGAGFELNEKVSSTTSSVNAGGKLTVSGKNVVSQEAELKGDGGKDIQGNVVQTKAVNYETQAGADFDLAVESKKATGDKAGTGTTGTAAKAESKPQSAGASTPAKSTAKAPEKKTTKPAPAKPADAKAGKKTGPAPAAKAPAAAPAPAPAPARN